MDHEVEVVNAGGNLQEACRSDNAYLKRALDQEEQYIALLQQQIHIMRLDCERLLSQATTAEAGLAERDQIIAEKERGLVERDQIIAEKERRLVERDQTVAEQANIIACHGVTLAEQMAAIDSQRQQLKGQEDRLLSANTATHLLEEENSVLSNELQAVSRQLASMETSTIWRATQPLRSLLDVLKGNHRGSN